MGKVLEFIQQHSASKYFCYGSKKISLDDNINDVLLFDDKSVSEAKKSVFAETDSTRIHTVTIPPVFMQGCTHIFRFFLDGSRRTYKVDDIAIGKKIFPIVAGQIIVGCCERKDRETFKPYLLHHRIVLSMPTDFDIDDENKNNNFCKLYCENVNLHLSSFPFLAEHNMQLHDLFLYETDGFTEELGKNKYLSRAVAKIQNEMTDEEQIVVNDLCENNLLDDENFLLKDGSIEYNPRFSNMDMSKWNLLRSNYKYVVGVSKSFDPELIPDFEGHKLSKTIAGLKPYQRTKVYRYESQHSGSFFAVWYLRLRNSDFRETNFSDIVKCEMVLNNESDQIRTSLIDLISANIIREAYPVCFGNDSRWANHLYPVYLTETFCKSHYANNEIIYKLF